MGKIMVIGASGTVGSELVKELRFRGQDVVRGTSHQSDLASDQIHVDLLRPNHLEKAFAGVDRLFMLSPPGFTNQHELLGPVIEAAQMSKVNKAVLMSAMGANAYSEAPLRKAEIQLEKSKLPFNIIRPNWFMQNFNTFWIEGILKSNTIFLPVGEARTSFIDARDIALVAAELLSSDRFVNRDFDLTGGESITHAEAAETISQATGKRVRFQDIAPSEMRELLLKAGLPKDYSEFLLMILDALKQGYSERRTEAVEQITGHKPRTFAQYANDYKRFWQQ